MAVTSPNMGLVVPTPQATGAGDVGPAYAQNVSNTLNTIDAHDHSSGKGVQITQAGINLTGDLSMQSQNLTNARAVRFATQATALSASGDVQELYSRGGDLYYVNGLSQQVQLTSGASVRPSLTDLIALGMTGARIVASGAAGQTIAGLVQWNRQDAQSGNLSQPTGNGTGSAWINANAAGQYAVNFEMVPSPTGSSLATTATGPNAFAFQTINATGVIGLGTIIPQSIAVLAAPGFPSGTLQPIGKSYVVSLGSGVNVETWIQVQANAGSAQGISISPTGATFNMSRIG